MSESQKNLIPKNLKARCDRPTCVHVATPAACFISKLLLACCGLPSFQFKLRSFSLFHTSVIGPNFGSLIFTFSLKANREAREDIIEHALSNGARA